MPYIDPTGRARAAIVALIAHIAALAGNMAATLIAPASNLAVGGSALLLLATNVLAVVLVAMWVYRVNANAHSFTSGLSITPGWAVGWYFIPIANLWKPFEAMRETWRASSTGEDWANASVPVYINLWWGAWIVGNMLANVSFQAQRMANDTSLATTFDLLSSGLLIVAAALMLRVISTLSAMQPRAHAAITFS